MHSISTCPDRRYTTPAEQIDKPRKRQNKHYSNQEGKPNSKQKGNTKNMTIKLWPFTYRQRSKIRVNRDTYRRTSSNRTSTLTSSNFKPDYGNNNFRSTSRSGSPYLRPPSFQNDKPSFNNNYTSYSRLQTSAYCRDKNRYRRLFSKNRFRDVRNYTNSLLKQEQVVGITFHSETIETQKISEGN